MSSGQVKGTLIAMAAEIPPTNLTNMSTHIRETCIALGVIAGTSQNALIRGAALRVMEATSYLDLALTHLLLASQEIIEYTESL
jgi:hypothetical protein